MAPSVATFRTAGSSQAIPSTNGFPKSFSGVSHLSDPVAFDAGSVIVTARSIGIRRGRVGSGKLRDGDFTVPRTGLLPLGGNGLRFIPVFLVGLLAAELAAERARDMYQASAPFPASPALFKFACSGVFRVAAFAFDSVAAVEFEAPYNLDSFWIRIARYCTLIWSVACKYLKTKWRRGGDSVPNAPRKSGNLQIIKDRRAHKRRRCRGCLSDTARRR
jgi:hypothetical protein